MTIYEAVGAALERFGYLSVAPTEAETQYAIDRAQQYILNKTALTEVPDGLLYVWADMAAGYLLRSMRDRGDLDGVIDFSAPAKSVKVGDTSVEYAGGATLGDRFETETAAMIRPDDSVFYEFRKLRW